MIKRFLFVLLIIMFSIYPVFTDDADYESSDYVSAEEDVLPEETAVIAEVDEETEEDVLLVQEDETTTEDYEFVQPQAIDYSEIPHSIRNNEFFLESIRLNGLAHEAFEFGDYDASAGFAEEAIRFAYLSDEYVASELAKEARRLLDWAEENNLTSRHASDYNQSREFYDASVEAIENGNFDTAIIMAMNSIAILSPHETGTAETRYAAPGTLPSQYTVRPWATSRDCFWNIAGYPFVYGDPRRWRVLYEANRSKLPNPNNPNLIEPGMVLDIPSISGEERSGMWRAQ